MNEKFGIHLLCILWLIQSLGRLSFAILGKPEGMGQFLDVPISYATSLVMFVMFLLLGIFGLIAAFGLWRRRKWGFWSTIAVSVATIAFDIYGITIQYTAALGFIVPTISILYLYPKKSKLLKAIN
ncbi:MAG: hypothetical protein C0193_01355 [Candidatus Bathyarchaeota archaeon]|nr:MAG: hypothetical protein C0193_01355 [Candidatus Bathyarchaeota archaeon]